MVNTAIYKTADRFPFYWLALGLICFVFGLGLVAMGGIIQSEEPTKMVTQTQSEFVSSSVGYSAIAQNNTSAYKEGQELVGSPLYTQDEYPVLNVSYSTTADRPADLQSRVIVEYRGVQQGYEFWNETQVIDSENVSISGDSYEGQTLINMTRITERAFSIRESFDGQGQVQVRVDVVTEYESDDYSGQTNLESDLIFTESTYSVIPPENSVQESETIQVQQEVLSNEHTAYTQTGGVLLVFALLFFLFHKIADPERVVNDYNLIKHQDWISMVDDVEHRTEFNCTVDIEKPEDLIDMAADNGGRIIWPRGEDRYELVQDDTICEYELKERDKRTIRGTIPGEVSTPDEELDGD